MSRNSLRVALAATCLFQASACSTESNANDSLADVPSLPGNAAVAGVNATLVAGVGSMVGASGAGVPRSPASAFAGAPASRSTGSSGATAMVGGGAGATPPALGSQTPAGGAQAAAGSQGVAGSPVAGAAGAAGSGRTSAQGGAPAEPRPFIREKDPTEQSVAGKGEYTVKSYSEAMGLVGGTAYGDAAVLGDGSELYYPEGATPPFASIVIVPGFTAQRSDIAPWASFLASHGIVSLAIDTNTVGDLPDVRSRGLLDALQSLKKENMREGSPIKNQLDVSRMAVMGWSMGGGGTWLTADGHPELKAAVSLCGWILDAVGSRTTVPSLQLAVRDDELAAGMSQPVYAAIPNSTPKMLVEWSSGGHWTNNTPSNQNNQVGRYGLAWLKVFLEGDDRYRQFFKSMPNASSDFKTNQK